MGREHPRRRARVFRVLREAEDERIRERRVLQDVVDRAEQRLVVEHPVPAPEHRPAVAGHIVRERGARRDVVPVYRVAAVRQQRVVGKPGPEQLEVVPDTEREREPVVDRPLVLREHLPRLHRVIDHLSLGVPHPHPEPARVGERVGGIEDAVGLEGERAVQIALTEPVEHRPVPGRPELQVVIPALVRHEPGEGVVELPVEVVPAARPGELVVVEARVTPLRRTGHLVAAIVERAVGPPARVAAVRRFIRAGNPDGVDLAVPDDARVRPDEDLIVVGLVLDRVQRRRPVARPG